jgi:hypothetical protein
MAYGLEEYSQDTISAYFHFEYTFTVPDASR